MPIVFSQGTSLSVEHGRDFCMRIIYLGENDMMTLDAVIVELDDCNKRKAIYYDCGRALL